MRDVVVVIGDPLMAADQLAGPTHRLLSEDYQVVQTSWRATFDEAVSANLRIERSGPGAVPAELTDPLPDARVVAVLTQFFPLTAETLSRWPRLRAVATLRAGTENIDLDTLRARDIAFSANAGRNAGAVAELSIALMLATLRNVGENHHSLRSGRWRPPPPPLGHRELAGRRLGVVGYGAVGRLLTRRLVGFDLDVAVHDPYLEPAAGGPPRLPLRELLARTDVLTLHARAAPGRPPLIGAEELDLLPEGAVVVNTARAELLDEEALTERLQDGRIAGAGLDVFSVEPLPTDHPLRSEPSVTLSPHLAGSTVEARSRAPELIAGRLRDLLASAQSV